MDIERKRVSVAPGIRVPASGRHEQASDEYDDAYDDISQSDDVSEALHIPTYRARENRGESSRGQDRLTVSDRNVLTYKTTADENFVLRTKTHDIS